MIGRIVFARCRRLSQLGDERGSLAMFLMVSIVGLMLGALMVPLIITQDRTTRFDKTRVHALDAAQAGVDAALGQIRAAVGGDGFGDNSKLPCAPAATPITGRMNSTAGSAAYSVTITYYAVGTAAVPSAAMTCVPGYGTFESSTGALTPHFALVAST
jgi:Tfp pilus assembly protein PilX